ncbi:MAG: M15 family metallopeptidase [Clostridia bacterium]|nr:M15 family metallopeptidase [Clostridia bacterium]
MKKLSSVFLSLVLTLVLFYAAAFAEGGIDYLVLVNKLNALPGGWEDALETVTVTNSVGDGVEVEKKAYDAYLLLKDDLEKNDGIFLELDSARRSVSAQQDIMDRFTEKYGIDYALKTVAVPGYSEHHTGLALDLYFRTKNDDGAFTDVYYNEDMTKPEYYGVWDAVHAKLADYGFILRYLKDKEYITGYGYEPWHIRYIDDAEKAKEIMAQPGLTFEVWLGAVTDGDPVIDYGTSELFTQEALEEAAIRIKCGFASFEGCELHSLRYAGDEKSADALEKPDVKDQYTEAAVFLADFHSPVLPADDSAWEPDTEYTEYEWVLARTAESGWQIVSRGQK